MQKFYLLFLTLLLGMNFTKAQSLERSVIGASGNTAQTPTLQLDWTLGELAIATLQHSKGQLTEGFHQANLVLINDPSSPSFNQRSTPRFNIAVRPNPVKDFLTILIKSELQETGSIQLFNNSGQLIQSLTADLQEYQEEVNLSKFPPGLYLLRFSRADGEILETFKIQKIN